MRPEDLKNAFGPVPKDFHDGLMAAASGVQEETATVRRKTWIVAFALALALLGGTAVAIVNYYDVAQYQPYENPTEEFIEHVTPIYEQYENDYLTISITDSIFDGQAMAVAMNIYPKDTASPVFLYPMLSATSNGKSLPISIEGCHGDFYNGFLFPDVDGTDFFEGNYGVDVIIEDFDVTGEVTWTLRIAILRPNWPLETQTLTPDWQDDASFEAYCKSFEDAFDNEKILIVDDNNVSTYASLIPVPDSIEWSDWVALTPAQKLAMTDAFDLIDTVECTFTAQTPEGYYPTIASGLTFPFDAYTVEFLGLKQTFMNIQYAYELVFPPETTDSELERYDESLEYIAYTPDGKPFDSHYFTKSMLYWRDDGSPVFQETFKLDPRTELPEYLVFVPWVDGKVAPGLSFTIPMGCPPTGPVPDA